MNNILIFGTGSGCKKALQQLNFKKVNIIAYIDNDPNKRDNIFHNKKIISPEEVTKFDYDYIIICSEYYNEMIKQLEKLGVRREKVLIWYYYCNDNSFNHELNKRKLKELIVVTSNYFIELKNKSMTFNKEKKRDSLLNSKEFTEFDRGYYNENYAKRYEDLPDCMPTDLYCEKIISMLLNKIDFRKEEKDMQLKMLDIGCGQGSFSEAFRKHGFLAYGIDYSSSAIKLAQSKYRKCKFIEMDALNPNFDEEKFDFLFMRGLSVVINTHNLNKIKDIADKYFDLLNYGGIFVISSSTDFSGKEDNNETVNLTMSEIEQLASMVHYERVDIVYPEEEFVRIKSFNEKKFFYLVLRKVEDIN